MRLRAHLQRHQATLTGEVEIGALEPVLRTKFYRRLGTLARPQTKFYRRLGTLARPPASRSSALGQECPSYVLLVDSDCQRSRSQQRPLWSIE